MTTVESSTELIMKVLRSFVKSDTALKDLPFNGSTSENSFHTQSFHVWLFTCQISNFGTYCFSLSSKHQNNLCLTPFLGDHNFQELLEGDECLFKEAQYSFVYKS